MGLKEEFWEEMNRHGNTKYKTIGGKYVVELVRFASKEKGILRVWRRAKPEEESLDGWVRSVYRYGDYLDMLDKYQDLSEKSDVTTQAQQHSGKRTA